jgi:hypothetical protein
VAAGDMEQAVQAYVTALQYNPVSNLIMYVMGMTILTYIVLHCRRMVTDRAFGGEKIVLLSGEKKRKI